MIIKNKTITLNTTEGVDIVDISSFVRNMLGDKKIENGQVTVFTRHTTTGIAINEYEDRLISDIKIQLENLAPKEKRYLHDDIHLRDCPPDERINGHSHLKALGLCASQSIPIIDGELMLGKWQKVLFFELDGSRKRDIVIQIMGE